jgi:PRTRC genetic system protein E
MAGSRWKLPPIPASAYPSGKTAKSNQITKEDQNSEIMPLLAGRTVMITVAREDEKTGRICVIPKKAKADDHPAVTTPLSYTGTPKKLDAELGKHLASYVECHTQPGSTLTQAKAGMEAAAKAAVEEACKKTPGLDRASPRPNHFQSSVLFPL